MADGTSEEILVTITTTGAEVDGTTLVLGVDLLEELKTAIGDPRYDEIAPMYLSYAEEAVVSRLWPFDLDKTVDDVPDRFRHRIVQIALYMLNKRGAEGELRHSENGTTHEWESSNIPESFFYGMVPQAGVPS